jgi:hypothetical protein
MIYAYIYTPPPGPRFKVINCDSWGRLHDIYGCAQGVCIRQVDRLF